MPSGRSGTHWQRPPEHDSPNVGQSRESSEQDEDGLEAEPEEDVAISRPFDPEKIKVQSTALLVGQMVTRMKHHEIRTPEFQRMAGIWRTQRKSRLIESLLLRIPIPVFYFSADEDDNWSVVDGLQRTTTIHEYVCGRFPLQGLEYLNKFDGKSYQELPRAMQRRIDETQLIANVIQPGTPEEVTFNIFSRINTGGMTLTGQEIRHAMNRGPVLRFLKDLAESNEFLFATGSSVNPERMADRECVLRFLSFHLKGWRNYQASDDLDRWLGDAMYLINAMPNRKRRELSSTFNRAMSVVTEVFGEYAFRKAFRGDDRKRPVNKALFEAWSVGIARCSSEEQDRLMEDRDIVVDRSYDLMNRDDFLGSVSTATGTASKVHVRFGAIDQLVEDCLPC